MPIYEFRCLNCNEINEFLFVTSNDAKEMACPQCGSLELERVMSTSNFSINGSGGKVQTGANAATRNCASGSCTTLEIPGKYE